MICGRVVRAGVLGERVSTFRNCIQVLVLQCFGRLMWRADSLEKTLMRERLKAGEGDDRGWDGWMASPTRWTWVWVNSRTWWWTGRPGVLQFMGLQRVGHDWATGLNWTELNWTYRITTSKREMEVGCGNKRKCNTTESSANPTESSATKMNIYYLLSIHLFVYYTGLSYTAMQDWWNKSEILMASS